MKLAIVSLAAAVVTVTISASPASSADTKTWYVYCEGNSHGDHWAVFSENFWPHPLTVDYGRQVGSAAKTFFETRHEIRLEGCAGVNFVDSSLAEHSRSRTAKLHRKMGDRVFFFPLPDEALPAEPALSVAVEMHAAPEPTPAAEPTQSFSPQKSDR